MYRYMTVNTNGYIIGESLLSGEVEHHDMILVDADFDATNKRYVDEEWVKYNPPEPPPYNPTPSQKRAESYATMTHKLDGTNLIDGELTVDSATNLLTTHYIPQGLTDKVTQTQTTIQNAKTYIKQIYSD